MEKYCVNCGKMISQEAEFCKYCGAPQSGKQYKSSAIRKSAQIEGASTKSSKRQKPARGKGKTARLIVVAVIALTLLAAGIFGAIWVKNKLSNNTETEKDHAAEQASNETTEIDKSGETEGNSESINESTETTVTKDKDSKSVTDDNFVVGETYTVTADPNLMVRSGPGKEYDILKRSDLVGNDYKQSVGTTENEKAAIDKGSKVVCLEMSGKWMKIESGWICTEDSGEVLVK